MKKLLSVLLALTLSSAVLVACTGEAAESTPADTTTAAPTTTTQAPAATTTAPVTTETPTPGTDEPVPGTDETPAPDVDTTGATNINAIEGVDARVYAFEYPSEFGGSTVALIYYFEDKTTNLHTDMATTITNGGYAVVYIDGEAYKIENYANGAPWFRMDVETPGATLISGLSYEITVYVYNAEETLVYYTDTVSKVSELSTANAPEREALNVELPENLTKVTADATTATVEGFSSQWGDGATSNLFDGNTTTTKIGGNTSGTVTVTFSLTEAATVTHYTLYTGGDTATNGARNPSAWTLYGEVDGEWVELSTVTATKTHVTGLAATNSTPYSYAVTNAKACQNYKIVFTTGSAFQLNEMELFVG
ncbi:MAG: hypothetical protein IJX76_04115 [Clostridia bacterium]|nr:hypothetical protein [Clostridia bacterium]